VSRNQWVKFAAAMITAALVGFLLAVVVTRLLVDPSAAYATDTHALQR
jgi:ABC-type uncharacterized transport system permease subunit